MWLGEQLTQLADELTDMFRREAVITDLTAAEHVAVRNAAAAARTAGGDVVLAASAAHHRAATPSPPDRS